MQLGRIRDRAGADEDHTRHALGTSQRRSDRDEPTHRHADEKTAPNLELIEEALEIRDEIVEP